MPRAIGGYADELESGGAASPSSLSPPSDPQLTFLPTQDDSRTAARLGALHQLTHCQSVKLLRAKQPAAQPGASSSTSSDSVQGGGSSGGNMRGPWEGQAAGSARNRAGLPTAALTAARFRGSVTQEESM
ncbi:hypothetical protein HaLaN_14988 [Haematococcus lacustris]|uniref:Uncharacterized protein n=1 Tax=Haematococcus lacustris TaxID=44745 RepID=A0A699ZQL1_HAELA|nr:hypothetical protein HaLaN_14988 [Haematococcus lacustris]